jgi:hypothetical protein
MTLAQALTRFNDAHGTAFAAAGGFDHGEVGATRIRDSGGREAVAKWFWPADPGDLDGLRDMVAIIDRLRARGARLPAYRHLVALDAGVLAVQELLPGTTQDVVGDALIDDLLAHNALQAGAVPDGRGWREYLTASLTEGLRGYCEHGSLHAHSAATRALLARVRATAGPLRHLELEERDAVHVDFHHLNVLQAGGRLTGVVDAEGYRAGDRVFDLVTLAFGLEVADCSADAVRRVWASAFAERDRATIRAYVAHMALRQVDWSIRHRTPADVDAWLERSERAFAGCA